MKGFRMCLFHNGILLALVGLTGCVGHRHVWPEGGDGFSPAAFYAGEAGVLKTPVSSVRFHDSGPAIRAEMLALVRRAKHHILLGSFLLNDGGATREILDALVQKASSGVKVRVIGDASSRFVVEKEAFHYLRSHKVETAEFNPVKGWRLVVPTVLLERDHRKFWVVDGRHVFLGGANVSETSLMPPARGGNRDLMVRLDSPEAARLLTKSFIHTWNESDAPEKMDEADFLPAKAAGSGGTTGVWLFDQSDLRKRESKTEVMMTGLFAAARRSVWLVQPYTFTNHAILDDVKRMTKRGVEVNLVLSSRARSPRFRYASYYGIHDLLKAGARVWIYDSAKSPLHYKCALVDDRLAYAGSANLNFRSFHLSRELNVVLDDADSIQAIRRVVDDVRKSCREVDEAEARRYRTPLFMNWWLIMQAAG